MFTFDGDQWIHHIDIDAFLRCFQPGAAEHARKVRTLAQVDFMQVVFLAEGADSHIGVAALFEQRLVDVLGSVLQLFPKNERLLCEELGVGFFTNFFGVCKTMSITLFTSSSSDSLCLRLRPVTYPLTFRTILLVENCAPMLIYFKKIGHPKMDF